MIYLGILKISKDIEKIHDVYGDKLSNAVKDRINNAQNPDSRISRIGAYSLLVKMYEDLNGRCDFSKKMPEIVYTGSGKPCFEDNNSLQKLPKFNISHDQGLCVCAFSDGFCDIGVDIQSMPKRKINLSVIADRFFAPLRNLDKALSSEDVVTEKYEIFYYETDGDEIVKSDVSKLCLRRVSNPKMSSDFLVKWTMLEAVLKMLGEGFGDVSAATELLDTASVITYSLSVGDTEYFISAAHKKQ